MNMATWPLRALFKYVFNRVLGTFVKTGIDTSNIDFSAKSFALSDIELDVYEINKMLVSEDSVLPFKLVSASVKDIDIPWGIFNLGQGVIEIQGVDILLMPCPTYKRRRRTSFDHSEDAIEEKAEEVSLSNGFSLKFLSNAGINVSNIAVRIVPCEFGAEDEKLQETPILLFRTSYISLKASPPNSRDLPTKSENGQNVDPSSTKAPLQEEFIPLSWIILRSKTLKFGQISLHLLFSPVGEEMGENSQKLEEMEFPFTSPSINHISTLVCIGNPDDPASPSFETSMVRNKINEANFEILTEIL